MKIWPEYGYVWLIEYELNFQLLHFCTHIVDPWFVIWYVWFVMLFACPYHHLSFYDVIGSNHMVRFEISIDLGWFGIGRFPRLNSTTIRYLCDPGWKYLEENQLAQHVPKPAKVDHLTNFGWAGVGFHLGGPWWAHSFPKGHFEHFLLHGLLHDFLHGFGVNNSVRTVLWAVFPCSVMFTCRTSCPDPARPARESGQSRRRLESWTVGTIHPSWGWWANSSWTSASSRSWTSSTKRSSTLGS